MRDALFDLCRRFADAHVDSSGVAVTPVPGITLVRALHPGDLQAAIARPLVAMLLQGRKSVTTGLASFDYGPGEAMVIAADVPTTSQITEASQRFPYYALVLEAAQVRKAAPRASISSNLRGRSGTGTSGSGSAAAICS